MQRVRRAAVVGIALLGSITCEEPFQPSIGTLTVTVQTVGLDLDPDGYSVVVNDDSAVGVIGPQGSLTLPDLAAGTYRVDLSGAAGNCRVNLPRPRPVNVPKDGVGVAEFVVNCIQRTGLVRFTLSTTGGDPDPDGYTLAIGTLMTIPMVPRTGVTVIPYVREGSYPVTIDDVAGNCIAQTPSPDTVRVVFDSTSDVAITVHCTGFTALARVTTTTTGADIDPDGYVVGIDTAFPGSAISRPIGTTSGISIRLEAGVHEFVLQEVAVNCTPVPAGPDTVALAVGDTVHLDYAVTCRSLPVIRVTTTTTGSQPDPDGYFINLDQSSTHPIGVNATQSLSVAPGSHQLDLFGWASNCNVTSPNPVQASLAYGDTVDVAFTLFCPAPGTLIATVATGGIELDADGYLLGVVGGGLFVSQPMSANDTVTLPALAPRDYEVYLSNVASNCLVAPASDTVTVVSGDTAFAAFTVTCLSSRGTLSVTTTTTGAAPDSNGYLFRVDEYCDFDCYWAFEGPIGVNDSVALLDFPVGGHTVTLLDLAQNCAVVGANPAIVDLPPGGAVTVPFTVTCAPPGTVELIVSTSGSDVDPDGYNVGFARPGFFTGVFANPNDTVFVTNLATADYSLTVGAVAPNCAVSGPNPRTVSVQSGDTAHVTIDVGCWALGAAHISVITTGVDLNPNDYRVAVFGGSVYHESPVAPNGSVLFAGLLPGAYTVVLSQVPANCTALPAGQVALNIISGDTAQAGFAITCVAALTFAFTRDSLNVDVYIGRTNGVGTTRLSTDPARDEQAAWSPSGAQLAFTSYRNGTADVYVMNDDGSGVTRLTTHAAADYSPSWSPDGARIAFVSERDGNPEIYVMNVDGSNLVRLTTGFTPDLEPTWSPDGTRIAFTSTRNGNAEIYVMNADGSGQTRLTSDLALDVMPEWSPDGTRIVFARTAFCAFECAYTLFVMNADGSGAVPLPTSTYASEPSWARDGLSIAFTRTYCDVFEGCYAVDIGRVRLSDGSETTLLNWARGFTWRP